MDRGSDGSGGSGEAVHGGDGGAYSTNGDLESPVLTKEKQGVQLSDEQRSSDSPQSGKGIRICLWFSLGFFIGVIFTQIPIPESPFSKELRKDSDTLHQFIVNDSKVIAKESRVIAGATENAAHALRLGGTTMSTTTTTTTTTTSTTTSTLPDPVFVTLQTKGSSLLQKVGGPFEVVNIGAGKPWHGYKTKFERLLPFLKSKKDDDLVAFMDGTDIFWGGCEMKDFLHYYQQIVEASGASIVISAEIACGEQPCNKVPPAPEWAVNLANISLNDGFWQKYVSPKGCGSVGCPCASPPAIKFLNSGFIIGPVKDLLPMISWSLDNYDKESTLGDQSVLAKYWFANTDQIALDYQGALCLSTSDLNPYTLFAKDPITGGLWNKAFGRMQCLTHGNGRGRYALWDLLGRFSLGKHGERYAKALKFKKL